MAWRSGVACVVFVRMEAFESFVALALESEGFVVSEALKFPVTQRTQKAAYEEVQTHGFEVDLVAARADRLVLATVKSFFGSRGVVAEAVMGDPSVSLAHRKRYALLNDPTVRRAVVGAAAKRFGYLQKQVELRLYVGRFAGRSSGIHEQQVRAWCATQRVGSGRIRVVGVKEVVDRVRAASQQTQYRDNAVLVAVKVLEDAGDLPAFLPEDVGVSTSRGL